MRLDDIPKTAIIAPFLPFRVPAPSFWVKGILYFPADDGPCFGWSTLRFRLFGQSMEHHQQVVKENKQKEWPCQQTLKKVSSILYQIYPLAPKFSHTVFFHKLLVPNLLILSLAPCVTHSPPKRIHTPSHTNHLPPTISFPPNPPTLPRAQSTYFPPPPPLPSPPSLLCWKSRQIDFT
jgi:hypothetical protein